LSLPRRLGCALALLAVALGSGAGLADPPQKPAEPDEELLEFLGTVDSVTDPTADPTTQPDDGSWIEYLSKTDIEKAAKKADAPAKTDVPGKTDAKPGAPKVKSDDE
jgi:hypothetical protein